MGLPKSGTTLVEDILRQLGAVDTFRSIIRRSRLLPREKHPHAIISGFFEYLPSDKYSFIKTHTHYSDEALEVVRACDVSAFVTIRDLRDVMISRYYHVMADPMHWQHRVIKDLPVKNGFIRSLYGTDKHPEHPIRYFSDWVSNHVRSSLPILRYEEYHQDSQDYIAKIAEYAGIPTTKKTIAQIHQALSAQKETQMKFGLKSNLSRPGREKTTIRKGVIGGWRDFFCEEISETFMHEAADALLKSGYEVSTDS